MNTWTAEADGLTWRWQRWGEPGASPLVLLHGYAGEAASWQSVAPELQDAYAVLAPDLPGHGGTGSPGPDWSLARAAAALAAQLPASFDLVGYSLGGRLALHLACAFPERVKRLVLVGASAGLPESAARDERRTQDARWIRLLDTEGLEAFVDAWQAQALFASQERLDPAVRAAERSRRLALNPRGLAAAMAAFGLGTQDYLGDRLPTMPTLWLSGAEDTKFAAIARRMAEISGARHALVPECGHNVPLERPRALAETIRAFARHPEETLV
ncbi:MAG TPA: 2-succinyl-6-hydroxy-2,4-cyclohexadiene-1-carboxylate synthase [Oscillatoriaceae cyanobacterium]